MLYRRHAQRVLRYCQRCLRRHADAEDALQQTFLQAHRALDRGVEPAAEVQWLLAIARNVCLTRADAQRRRSAAEISTDVSAVSEAASPAPVDAGVSAELRAAFVRLPRRQRDALFLREWQELSYAEIADTLGISASAVETLIFRARRTLAHELAPVRRRRLLGPLGLLGWMRGGLASGTAKLALGAAVATTAAGTAVTVVLERPAAVAPVPRHAAPTSQLRQAVAPVASQPAAAHAMPRRVDHRMAEAPSTQRASAPAEWSVPTTSPAAAPVQPGPAAEPVQGSGRSPAPVTATTASASPRSEPVAPASSSTDPAPAAPPSGFVPTVTAPVSDALSSAVGQTATTVSSTVGQVTSAVEQTATAVGATVDAVAGAVTTAAPASAPAVAPVSDTVSTATATVNATADSAVGTVQSTVETATTLTSKLLSGR